MCPVHRPEWLTEEGIERTQALGREMAIFLQRRSEAKRADPDTRVEPHERLLELVADLEERVASRHPGGQERK